jgi:uncharacterized membrane protein YphA (DoxX/SURF4 family)
VTFHPEEDAMKDRIEGSYWALRIVFGVVPIVAGLDKFTNLLTDWQGYLSPLAMRLLPVPSGTFMAFVGVVEIAVGAGVLLGYARVFAWVAAGWLLAISVNLLLGGSFLDVAARDVALAVAAGVLARIAPLHERAGERRAVPGGVARAHA